MALIPMDPRPQPHRWRFVAAHVLLVLLAMAIGAPGGLLDTWGRP